MHTSNTFKINVAIRSEGLRHITLNVGKGYQYLTYDDGKRFETRSVYVNRVRDLSVEQWVLEAQEFASELE